jgi:hypothetical protein
MSIEKKSLISTLKTTKKANVAKEDFSRAGTSVASVKSPVVRGSLATVSKMKLATAQKGKMLTKKN